MWFYVVDHMGHVVSSGRNVVDQMRWKKLMFSTDIGDRLDTMCVRNDPPDFEFMVRLPAQNYLINTIWSTRWSMWFYVVDHIIHVVDHFAHLVDHIVISKYFLPEQCANDLKLRGLFPTHKVSSRSLLSMLNINFFGLIWSTTLRPDETT